MTPSTPSLVGRILTDLFRTEWSKPQDILPGIKPAYYYSVVLQTDARELYELSEQGATPWASEERLVPVHSEEHGIDPTIRFRGERIESISEDEHGIASLVLQNGAEITVFVDYGTQLCIQKPNQPAAGNAGSASGLAIGHPCPGVPEPGRSASV